MRADPKERDTNNNTLILSGKYQIIRCLGTGQTSKVYLARHLSLNTDCAIKISPKSLAPPISVLSEAQLLKSIHHPGIPTIYDFEEDETSYYLIEEYVPGESLEVFLLHQKFISQSLFLSFCEQLGDIFHYLHTLHPVPIMYQDLKPEHIIVCGLQLKLIDFGGSNNTGSSGNNFISCGNIDFSAPECFSGGIILESADVYSLGKIFQLLLKYLSEPVPRKLHQIIQTATATESADRYETVDTLIREIRSSLQQDGQPHLCKTIAVTGSYSGCGSTHLAISLVSTLNAMGCDSFYFEKNEANNLRKMKQHISAMKEQNGYYSYRYFKGYPHYGPGIQLPDTSDALQIHDYGSSPSCSELAQADMILLICGSALWHRDDAIFKEEFLHHYRDRLFFICNPGDRQACHYFAKRFRTPVHPYFFDPDPFQVTAQKKDFANQLRSEKGRTYSFWDLHAVHHLFHKP